MTHISLTTYYSIKTITYLRCGKLDSINEVLELSLLKDQIYRKLKMDIILGRLEPGTRLSSLELANSMNVSNAPVREAINMLSKDGFLTMNPRKQPVIKDISSSDEDNIRELRLQLEPLAGRKACRYASDRDLEQVKKLLDQVLENPNDLGKYIESDLKLHQLIYSSTGFELLREILNMLQEHSLRIRYLPERKSNFNQGIILVSTKEHLGILEKLMLRDEDGVAEAISAHIRNTANRIS